MPLPPDLAAVATPDIYLLDQVLRGRIGEGMTALDVGCGDGRNIPALLAAGCAVSAIDRDPCAVELVRARYGGRIAADRLVACELEAMPFAAGTSAVVVVSAVLH